MENLFVEALKQVPALSVLGFVVWMFLRHLEASRVIERDMFINIHKENLEARQATREALHENAQVTRANTEALVKLSVIVSENLHDRYKNG